MSALSEPRTLSAGVECADCGVWPMPEPFNAVVEADDTIDRYICDTCAAKLAPILAQLGSATCHDCRVPAS